MHRHGTEDLAMRRGPRGRIEQERVGLVAAKAAMRAHELLERGHLAGLRVPQRVEHHVRAVREGVGVQHLTARVVTEGSERILTDQGVGLELDLAVGAEHEGTAGL